MLVQIDIYRSGYEEHLEEFQALVDSAGIQTLTVVTGKRTVPEPKFYVGTGKAEEIRLAVQTFQAEVVIFNHELTPAQGRNLEQLFHCRVLDRTELILDIFAQRAHTYEGKLQVELAQLQHIRTCLVRGWTHLERQKGGIGLRGPGETQLETDRRLIDQRIKSIQKRLHKVLKQREQSRRARHRAAVPTVSIVGYTNAGKSTLFNALTSSQVYAADQLFATLDPTLRQLTLPKLGKVVLADTVGFIRELPHDLVAAFRATLEETRQADLLLHVVDASLPDTQDYIDDVDTVLAEIGAAQVPVLQVFNKIDLRASMAPHVDDDQQGEPTRVWVSAQKALGFELLIDSIVKKLQGAMVRCQVTLSPDEGRLRARLYEQGAVLSEETDAQGQCVLEIELQRKDYDRIFGGDSR